MAFNQLCGVLDNMDMGFEAVVLPSGKSGSGGGLFARAALEDTTVVLPQQDYSAFMSPAWGNQSGIGGRELYHSLFCTELANNVCGQCIGTSEKFCMRPCGSDSSSCHKIKTHAKAKKQPIYNGTWYAIGKGSSGPSNAAFVTSSLEVSALPAECHYLINDSQRGMTKWALLFSLLSTATDAD